MAHIHKEPATQRTQDTHQPRNWDRDNRWTHRDSTIHVSTIFIHPHTCHLSSHYRSLTLYVPPQARPFPLSSSIDSLTTATS